MKPTRWWRSLLPDGSLWCETSDPSDSHLFHPTLSVTVQRLYEETTQQWVSERPPEPDDDGDDDDEPADGESFDGGFGQGSYFNHAMRKDD